MENLEKSQAHNITCGFNKRKNRGLRTPPDATLFHDFSYGGRDTFAYGEDWAHEQGWRNKPDLRSAVATNALAKSSPMAGALH